MSTATMLQLAIDKINDARSRVEETFTKVYTLEQNITTLLQNSTIGQTPVASINITTTKTITVGVGKQFTTIKDGILEGKKYRADSITNKVVVAIDSGVYEEDFDLSGIRGETNLVVKCIGSVTVQSPIMNIRNSVFEIVGDLGVYVSADNSDGLIESSTLTGDSLTLRGYCKVILSDIRLNNFTLKDRIQSELGEDPRSRVTFINSSLDSLLNVTKGIQGIPVMITRKSDMNFKSGSAIEGKGITLLSSNDTYSGTVQFSSTDNIPQHIANITNLKANMDSLYFLSTSGSVLIKASEIVAQTFKAESINREALEGSHFVIDTHFLYLTYGTRAMLLKDNVKVSAVYTNLDNKGSLSTNLAHLLSMDCSLSLGTVNWISGSIPEPLTIPSKNVMDTKKNLVTYI